MEQPRPVSFNVRLPAELHAWVQREAQREHRSLNGQIVHLLTLARAQSEHSAQPAQPPQ